MARSDGNEQDGAGPRPASPLADQSFVALLAKSPTLRSGIGQLGRDEVVVLWGRPGGGTYIVPGEKIVIDENAIGQGAKLARSISHEIGHHLHTERRDQSSKQAYVDSMLRGEAAATLSNVQVQREILAAGGPDIGVMGTRNRPQQYGAIAAELDAGRINRNEALSQIAEVFKTETPSVGPHANYELYYGAIYDQDIAPTRRQRRRPEPDSNVELSAVTVNIGATNVDSPPLGRGGSTAELGVADRALYMQIKAGVERLDAEHGKTWDESSQRMSASLLVLAKEQGLSRVDHVVFNNPTDTLARGERVFVVQGAMNDPAHRRAHMNTMDALRTPEPESLHRADALSQSQAASLEPQQAQQMHAQNGPSVSR